jgi:hypothetical protein
MLFPQELDDLRCQVVVKKSALFGLWTNSQVDFQGCGIKDIVPLLRVVEMLSREAKRLKVHPEFGPVPLVGCTVGVVLFSLDQLEGVQVGRAGQQVLDPRLSNNKSLKSKRPKR